MRVKNTGKTVLIKMPAVHLLFPAVGHETPAIAALKQPKYSCGGFPAKSN